MKNVKEKIIDDIIKNNLGLYKILLDPNNSMDINNISMKDD
mgnify:CR=1 FL=1|tara:strand:- start:411 stop:533 length:123 start_codon:yes stop_codon:yes gene_type:complete